MKFSPNGQYLLLGTRESEIMLLDAYKGNIIHRFVGQFTSLADLNSPFGLECGFSPDSRYVITGSSN